MKHTLGELLCAALLHRTPCILLINDSSFQDENALTGNPEARLCPESPSWRGKQGETTITNKISNLNTQILGKKRK